MWPFLISQPSKCFRYAKVSSNTCIIFDNRGCIIRILNTSRIKFTTQNEQVEAVLHVS